MSAERAYLLIIHFADTSRLKSALPQIHTILKASSSRVEPAFNTKGVEIVGFVIKTAAPLRQIRAELYGETQSGGTAVLLNDDKYLAIEIGKQFDGRGFSTTWTWIQHHAQ